KQDHDTLMSNQPKHAASSSSANYQWEIYSGPSADSLKVPFTFSDLEQKARAILSPGAFGYIAGGAGAEETVRANREAFGHWRIVPRMLRNIARRDLRTTVLGTEMSAPVMLAPVGALSIAHAEAELAVARAAASLDLPMVLSTASSHCLEEVAQSMGR